MSEEDEGELTPSEYLFDLAERIFRIAVMHGVNGYDYDRVRRIAHDLKSKGN